MRAFVSTVLTSILAAQGASASEHYYPEGDSIYFAVVGDYGTSSSAEREVARLVDSRGVDFVITLGDNNYEDGCKSTIDKNIGQYYAKYIYNYKGAYGPGSLLRRFFPSLGNHDWNAKGRCMDDGQLPYVRYFDLPGNERYYDFVQGPAHFFALDSDDDEPDGIKVGQVQNRWFKTAATGASAPFRIAFFHHPPYSSGRHGSEMTMRWDFDKHGIDLVLAGHEHSYERLENKGVTYIINGLGGAKRYDLRKKAEGHRFFYNKKHGATFIRATSEEMAIELVTTDQVVRDRITLPRKPRETNAAHLIGTGDLWEVCDTQKLEPDWFLGAVGGMFRLGYAPFGVGYDGIAANVNKGVSTAYFRKTVRLEAPERYGSLTLTLKRDDGAVVYLNGHRILVENMPDLIAYSASTTALRSVVGADEAQFFSYELPSAGLLREVNVVAVEVHQADDKDQDLAFDMTLRANVKGDL